MALDSVKFFNYYFYQSVGQVESLLSDFIRQEKSYIDGNVEVSLKLLPYAKYVYARLQDKDFGSRLWQFDAGLARLIDGVVVKNFLADPSNWDFQAEFANQLVTVAGAMGFVAEGIEPYTLDDWGEIVAGVADYSHPLILLYSVRQIVAEPGNEDKFAAVVALADIVFSKEKTPPALAVTWDEAIFKTSLLFAVWIYFEVLNVSDQAMLLSSTFYHAVVVGVPIREIIEKSLENGELIKENEAKRFLQSFRLNTEWVPVKTDYTEFTELSRLFAKVEALQAGESGALEIDEFCKKIYLGQKDRDFFSGLLRETLTIARYLEK